MARIAGVNLPNQKRLEVGLTYIYGIGPATALKVCMTSAIAGDEGQGRYGRRDRRSSSGTSTRASRSRAICDVIGRSR